MVGELTVLPRTSFNSSKLIRLLADLDIVGPAPLNQSFAESLSTWLNWTDAISLSSALSNARDGGQVARAPETQIELRESERIASLIEECDRVHRDMAQFIASDALLSSASAGMTPHKHAPADRDGAAYFSSYLRSYQSHQRTMESRIGPLRAKTRASLSASSAELGHLATLDVVLEKALSARERQLLSTVPVLLRNHFERSRQAEQETPALPREADPGMPVERLAQGLATFGRQVQSVLLAELEVRLLPVVGMIETLRMAADTKAQTLSRSKTHAAAAAAAEATSRP